jgi:hypothetical protein
MTTAISPKLIAKVISSVDLNILFPSSTLRGLVAFDVYVEKGAISTGKTVWLSSHLGKEEIVIKGIEMVSNGADPDTVRILCSKPERIEIPLASSEVWVITEE